MDNSRNLFSLFEHNKVESRAIESRIIVADVLAKFERYTHHIDLQLSKQQIIIILNH